MSHDAEIIPMNDHISFQDLLDAAVEIRARLDERAEGGSNER